MKVCLDFCTVLFAIACAAVTITMIQLYSGLFIGECPSIYGRTCNGHGTCFIDKCECEPLFSGEACQDTGVAGYQAAADNPCNNQGIVPPFYLRENIIPECFQQQPTEANQLERKGDGYDDVLCQRILRENRKAILSGTFTSQQALGTPMCLCRPGFVGDACEIPGCPIQIATNLICSGNGNKSVNFMNNVTSGLGCQCTQKLFLRQLLRLPISNAARAAISVEFQDFFRLGVCARVIAIVDGYPIIIPSDAYQCFCDARHEGEVCENGVCPEDVEGNACSGFGHRNFGFGAEKNTTRAISEFDKPCDPVCAKGTTFCRGVCLPNDRPCVARQPRCPADRPYRCPSFDCVSETQNCAAGYVYGYLDDPMLGLQDITATTRFNSPVLFYSAYINNGSITYRGETIVEPGPVIRNYSESLVEVEQRLFTEWGETFVNSEGLMYPVPFYNLDGVIPEEYLFFRIIRNDIVIVLDSQFSTVLFNQGTDVLANVSDTEYVMPGGRVVSLQECVDNFGACVWTTNYTSRDGTRKLCLNGVGDISDAPIAFNCPVPLGIPLRRGQTAVQVTPRFTAVNLFGRWQLQTFVGPEVEPTLEITGDVVNVRVLTVEAVRRACLCPIAATNQSRLNEQWYNAVARLPTSSGLAVAKTVVYGDTRYVRGAITSPGFISTAIGLFTYTGDAKHITQRELSLGTPSCVDAVFPLRCPDFSCASLETYQYKNSSVQCSCVLSKNRNANCVCDDGVTNATCTCDPGGCSCFQDRKFELALFDEMQTYGANQSCFIVQPNGPWQFPVQIIVDGCGQALVVEGFLITAWQPVEFETHCDVNNRTIIIPQQYTIPYEDFRVVNQTAEVEFIPWGVSAYLVTPDFWVSASSNEQDAINAIVDDFSVWRASGDAQSFLRVDFDRKKHFIGVYIVFETVGFEIPGYGNFTARVEVQGGSRESSHRSTWKSLNSTASNVVDGHFSAFVAIDYYGESLRLASDFPMSVRRFMPLVNQNCDLGEIIVQPESDFPQVRNTNFSTRTEPNCTCFCVDNCVIAGVRLFQNGICEDYRYVTRDVIVTNVDSVTINASYSEIVWNTTDVIYFFPNYQGFHIWSNLPDLPDTSTFNANVTSIVGGPNTSYIPVLPNLIVTNISAFRVIPEPFAEGYVEGLNTCTNGTDCSDCGNSCRFQDIDPDLQCQLSPYDLRMQAYLQNTSGPAFHYTLETDELLDRLFLLNFTVSLRRDVWQLGRSLCGDCDGRVRCLNGECRDFDYECPENRYDCPGDGCLQPDVNRKQFKCACAKTHNGLDCSFTQTVPLDTTVGLVDPHQVASCSDSPPLKIRPPFSEVKRRTPYNSRDVLVLNRRTPRQGPQDVGWVNVQADFAPFGYAFFRTYYEGGVLQYTNCPYYVIDPLGVKRQLEECVAERSPIWPHPVTRWRDFMTVNGSKVQYVWDGPYYEVKYDMAPHRCTGPTYFGCVPTAKDCYNEGLKNPACGGHGECLSDGSCGCRPEWETWVLNPTVTQIARFPYYAVGNETNPVQWGRPNPTQYAAFQCGARNCSVVDCSPPIACYAGDPLLNLGDALIPCGPETQHLGFCAVDIDACKRGDVVPPVTCSGNGILRKVDYRDEWYCACGTPKSNLVQSIEDVKTTPELTPNGFGGVACAQYYCADQTGVYFSRQNKQDGGSYFDADGLPLPGRWFGSCGAPAGPAPEDLPQWQSCCPGIKRLEKCENVLCDVGAKFGEKVTQCLPIEQCRGEERRPRIYDCNNHGRATEDSRCDCERDETRGTGYTYDYSVFQYQGCFRTIKCALALDGTVCNAKPKCGAFDWWPEFPPIKYADNQLLIFAQRAGLPMTNETLVNMIAEGIDDYTYNVLLLSMEQIALSVQRAVRQLDTTICVLSANESAADPPGMVPYVGRESIVGPYLKGYAAPFMLVYNSSFPLLNDRLFTVRTDLQNFVEGVDYLFMNSTFGSSDQLVLNFSRSFYITAIRVHAWYNPIDLPVVATMQFRGVSGFVCGDLSIPETPTFQWQGPSLGLYCVPSYRPYVFRRENPTDFLTQCQLDETSDQCIEWKDATCVSVGGTVNPPGNFTNLYLGCNNERCCLRVGGNTFLPTDTLTISLVNSTNTPLISVLIDEIQVYGYADSVLPIPEGLRAYLSFVDEPNVTCADERYLRQLLGSDNAYYPYVNFSNTFDGQSEPDPQTNMTYDNASVNCMDRGGVLATSRGAESQASYALFVGEACPEGNCLVDARNRNEIREPPVDESVEQTCLDFGCWTPINQNFDSTLLQRTTLANGVAFYSYDVKFDYVSTPGDNDGLQWQTGWTGGFQMQWPDMIYRQLVNANHAQAMRMNVRTINFFRSLTIPIAYRGFQRQYDIYRGVDNFLPEYPWAAKIRVDPNCPQCNNATYNCGVRGRLKEFDNWCCESVRGGVNYGFDCAITSFFVSGYGDGSFNRLYGQLPPVQSTLNSYSPNTPIQYWTNPERCMVTIFSEPGCGLAWERGPDYGCMYRIEAGPENDYAAFREIFLGDAVYTECAGLREQNDVCQGCLGMRVRELFSSVVVNGPCQAEISGLYYKLSDSNTPDAFYRILLSQNPYFGAHFAVTRAETVDQRGTCDNWWNNNGIWVLGCYSQICSIRCWNWDLTLTGQRFAPYGFPQSKWRFDKWGQQGCRGHRAGTLATINLIPNFDTRKVAIHLRPFITNPIKPGPTDNSYYLDYFKHIFMCMRIEIHVSQEIASGLDGRRNTDYWYRLDPVVWGVSVTPDGRSTAVIVEEKNPTPQSLHVNTDFRTNPSNVNRPMQGDIFIPVKKCDGVELPRHVRRCLDCIVPQPDGDWQWNQQLVLQQNPVFQSELLFMRQTLANQGQPVKPVLYFQFWSAMGNRSITALLDLQFDIPAAFARLISDIRSEDYKRLIITNNAQPGYFFDNCVRVMPNLDQTSVKYRYDTAVCELPFYKAVCMYDYQKYVVQPGRQCDQCGPSSCQKLRCQGDTAFSLNALANPELFPYQHALYNAMLQGRLNEFAITEPTDYNAIMEYIYSLNQSLVLAFPEARRLLYEGVSDRPGRVTRGQVANPYNWVDMDFQSWFSYGTCPTQFSRATGISSDTCASAVEYCNPESTNQFEGPPMAVSDIPAVCQPFTGDPTLELSCGLQVSVSSFFVQDSRGGPAPRSTDFSILESHPDYVILRFFVAGGLVRNTAKPIRYIFQNNATVTGTIVCEKPCSVSVWISTLNPFFGEPVSSHFLGSTNAGDYSFVVANLNSSFVYQNLWFAVTAITPSTTIKIENALVTDAASIQTCLSVRCPQFVETPSFTYSAQVQHRCIYTPDEARVFGAKTVGVCQAADSSPWGGDTNEFPTVISYRGKNICNLFGDSDSLYYSADGSLVPVNIHGAYRYNDEFYQCKCRWDVGKIINTRLRGTAVYDFGFIQRSDNLPNVRLYISVEEQTIIDSYGLGWPTTFDDSEQVCAASSDSLVSFISADEFDLYLNEFAASSSPFFGQDPSVFMDIGFDRLGNLRWIFRGELIENCAIGVGGECGNPFTVPICDNVQFCDAYNFNNLVYLQASSAFMTDGYNVTGTAGATITIPLIDVQSDGVTIEIWSDVDTSVSAFFAETNGTANCDPITSGVPSLYIFDCNNGAISSITLQRTGGLTLREVLVFDRIDSGRTFGIFESVE